MNSTVYLTREVSDYIHRCILGKDHENKVSVKNEKSVRPRRNVREPKRFTPPLDSIPDHIRGYISDDDQSISDDDTSDDSFDHDEDDHSLESFVVNDQCVDQDGDYEHDSEYSSEYSSDDSCESSIESSSLCISKKKNKN